MRDQREAKLQTARWDLSNLGVALPRDRNKRTATFRHLPGCQAAHLVSQKKTFEPEGVKIQEEIPSTSEHDYFGLTYLLVRSRFRRLPKQGNSTYRGATLQSSSWASSGKSPRKAMQTPLQATSTPRLTANAERRISARSNKQEKRLG